MNRCIVTGGMGYIGSILIRKLIEQGREVVVIDPGWFGYNLEELQGKITMYYKGIELFLKNQKLSEKDTVFHLSGLSNDPMADFNPDANKLQNTLATGQLAYACCQAGVKKFIFASSASVYGFHDDGAVNEEHEINPQSHYAKSKYHAEQVIQENAIQRNSNFRPVIFRNATVMGVSPRMRFDLVVNTMTANAYFTGKINLVAGGETWRPLVNVEDVANAFIWAENNHDRLFENGAKSLIFNLVHKNYRVSELGLYIRDCIHTLKPSMNIEVTCDRNTKEVRSYCMSGKKLELAGFTPKIGVLETVQRLLVEIESKRLDFHDPIYYNIRWLRNCERVARVLGNQFDMLEKF